MEEVVSGSLADGRVSMLLLSAFAGIALLLAALGIYGVMAYAVSQRRREIGIRMALGATIEDIRRMVLRQGLRLAGTGIAIGLVGASGFARLLSTQLYGVSASDPATFAGVAAGLLAIALVAAYVPGLRASRVDPATALRAE
jgi:ABC-type antimicrobial peptide transport system permease subunit